MGYFIELYGFKWFFGGSQNKLINYLEKTNSTKTVVKMVNNETNLWAIMESEELRSLVKKHNSFICEVLHKYPKKLYLDIDCTVVQEGFNDFNYKDILETIKEYIPDAKFAVSGSIEAHKKSFHVVIHNYIVNNNKELSDFKVFLDIVSKKHPSIDTAVYTSNRTMKCVHQSKDKTRAIQSIIEDQDETHHFIGSFLNGDEKHFKDIETLPDITKEDFNAIRAIKEFKQSNKETIKTYSKINDIAKFIVDLQFNPVSILNYIPPLVDHSITWKVFLFCHGNNFSFETFWGWASKKDNSIKRLAKWQNYWDTEIKTQAYKKYYKTARGMIDVLALFYPELIAAKSDTDIYTNRFKLTFNLSIKPTMINSITQKHLNTDHKVVIFNIGMGGGKTTNAIKYLKDKEQFYWITPRVALAANTFGSMERAGIKDVIYYKSLPAKTKRISMNQANKLIVQGESLHYLENIKNSIVVIDEIETVINSFTGETHNDRGQLKDLRKTNFTNFLNILRNASKVILIDAFTTQKTIDLISAICGNNIIVYESNYKPKEKQIIHYDESNTEVKEVMKNIHNDLKDGKKVYIFYPFKNPSKFNKSILQIYEELVLEHKDKRIALPITGDSTLEEKMKLVDANTFWKEYDAILVNGSITVGVNFDLKHFDKIYMFVSSYCNLPRDIIQASMRIRQTTDSELVMYTFTQRKQYTFETNDYYDSNEDPIYNNMFNEVMYENRSNWLESIKFFSKLTNYIFPDEPKPEDILNNKLKRTEINEYKTDYPYHMVETIQEIPEQVDYCSYEELLKYKKYFFDIKFDGLHSGHKEQIWNLRLEDSFDKLKEPIINMINKDNNIDDIRSLNWDKIKVSDETNEYLSNHYKCTLRYPITRIVKTLNEVFSIIFVDKKTKQKNTYYSLSKLATFLLEAKEQKKLYEQSKINKEFLLELE